ncbi:MAG: helix-turn-helix domain-containing protein, partial [Deltaproteobacteria bacterium]|nr:helix-turn-helix domain-containing protein [Deltaproteobacteria bacterium]
LYYRLSIVPITLPPLRERLSDLPLLVNYFLGKYRDEKTPIRIEPKVIEHLKTFSWPGNVRELANIIQQMVVFRKENIITTADLPSHLLLNVEHGRVGKNGKVHLMQIIENLEKKTILTKLKETNWNQEKAAELLGFTRKMLSNRIKKYHLKSLKRDDLSHSHLLREK